MADQRYFLAISNPRCGSSFLQSSLACLPDIATDYELLWEGSNPGMRGAPPYAFCVPNKWNWKEFLRNMAPGAPVAGTWLALPALTRYSPFDAHQLVEHIDKDITIIHIVRDYFDIRKSSTVRDHITWVSTDSLEQAARSKPALDKTNLWSVLRSGGRRKIDNWNNIGRPPLGLSSLIVTRYFLNDLLIGDIARRAARSIRVEFEEKSREFHKIARFIGSDHPRNACDAIARSPVVKRLPPIPNEDLPHWRVLKQRCGYLNDQVRDLLEREVSIFEVWKEGKLHIPKLPQASEPGKA